MDKEIKKEFEEIKKIIKSNSQEIKKLAKKVNEDLPTAEMVNKSFESVTTKKDLENFATKKDLENFATKKDFGDLEDKIDTLSASLQTQKNVPIIRKLNKKVNKHVEINYQRKNITQDDVKEIKRINPFSEKPAVM